jgi:hypothetical protein
MWQVKHLLIAGMITAPFAAARAGVMPVDLGAAASFAVLAGSTVTNTGGTVVNGDLGLWPGTAVTGFPPGQVVNGSIYAADSAAQQAQLALVTAYTTAANETGGSALTGENLGGLTLAPGLYDFASSAQLTGTLTLNAEGQKNALFIFQIGSTLDTASNAIVNIINAAQGDRVFWQVGSAATLGTATQFEGEILAETSITLDTGASIACGGALAINGAVTLDTNSVSTTGSACGASSSVPEPPAALLMMAGVLGVLGCARFRSRGGAAG